MKSLILLFVLLFAGFLGTWTYKINTPINRPDEYAEGYDPDAGAWWNTAKVQVDDNWKLDPTIPLNYIPVPGEYELYMVIDNNGNIIGYRKRTKQIDGSWKWEDVNPDIPDDYEPVEGLENVYKVTQSDGSVKYFKYVRNADDTFAFVEVDENGNPINKNRDATKIDGKHVHITGNVYKLLDDNGVVIGYDKRVDNGDGTFSWMDTEMPALGSMEGIQDQLTLPDSGTKRNMEQGGLDTSVIDKAVADMNAANAAAGQGAASYDVNININGGILPNGGYQLENPLYNGGIQVVNNTDGTHTETKIVRESKNIDGFLTTYETYVMNTYDDAGNLISTQSKGPFQVESKQDIAGSAGGPLAGGSTNTESTISAEASRVTGSYSYDNATASEVANKINAQRTSNGLQPLQVTDDAMRVAALRAADMAANDTGESPLPTYGGLSQMLMNFGVPACATPLENLWKTVEQTADDIHTRMQAVEVSREARMSTSATQMGIAIVKSNSYMYICEVFI